MNTANYAPNTERLLSRPTLRWAGLAAVAGCAAACSAPLLLTALGGAALGGSAAATVVAAFQGAGVELAVGVLAFVCVLGALALREHRRSTVACSGAAAPEPSSDALPLVCVPTRFTKAERAEHLEQTKSLLVERPARRKRLENGIEFHYTATDDLFLALAAWARFEHRCCAWARFTLELEPFAAGTAGGITLRMTGSAEIAPLLVESLKQLDGAGPVIQEFLRGDSVLTLPSMAARARQCCQ